VRSIIASRSRSWNWFRAEAPEASRKTPDARKITVTTEGAPASRYPVSADNVAKREMGKRQRIK
jgi:hypothetical protein